ncbi:MAG: hypothetical protein QXG08_07635 [Candidatus Methanomethyliaceae archaeon]
MVFKHGLIPLEVHSWLTANLAATLAREKGYGRVTQYSAWLFGLVHDAGVLSLQPKFDHTRASEREVDLLLEVVEGRYGVEISRSSPPLSDLAEFARLHASTHLRNLREGARLALKGTFGAEVVECVVEADRISTGRERMGYQSKAQPIFRSFTTDYVFDSPYENHNICCFMEHIARIEKFRHLLKDKAEKIRAELGVPRYDPVVSESFRAVEYYLSQRDWPEVDKEMSAWLEGRRVRGEIVIDGATIRTSDKKPSMRKRCFICGRPGRFYKGVGRKRQTDGQTEAQPQERSNVVKGRHSVSRVLDSELDTWRGEFDGGRVQFQDHRFGICDDCASAIQNNFPIKREVLIYMPRPEDLCKFYSQIMLRKRLKEWEEWKKLGRCDPDPRFLDATFWTGSPDYSSILGGLDGRRARYERAIEIFRESLRALGAEDRGVYGSSDLTEGFIERLRGAEGELAPISYGRIKPGDLGKVVVKGFALPREVAVQALRIIQNKVELDRSKSLSENLHLIAQGIRGLRLDELDLIVANYDLILEATQM